MNIEHSALSLLIHKQGFATAEDVDYLIDWYSTNRGISIDRACYLAALETLREVYANVPVQLMICTDKPCEKRSCIDTSEPALALLTEQLDCPVIKTGCHWQCDEASVLTLKTGDQHSHYLRCNNEAELQAAMTKIGQTIKIFKDKQPDDAQITLNQGKSAQSVK